MNKTEKVIHLMNQIELNQSVANRGIDEAEEDSVRKGTSLISSTDRLNEVIK
jgi:hypothetical protein